MSDGSLWYKADEALAAAESRLSGGTGMLIERVRDATVPLAELGEDDVPGWTWVLVEQVVAVGEDPALDEEAAQAFVKMVRDLRIKLDAELDEGSSLYLCPRCRLPMVLGEVTMRRGAMGRLTQGDGLTVRFTSDDAREHRTVLEPVDAVTAYACAVCDGVFLARDLSE